MGATSRTVTSTRGCSRVLALILLTAAAACSHAATRAAPAQRGFATPQAAAEALVDAAARFDLAALRTILGPDGEDLVSSEDPVRDENNATAFAAQARESISVKLESPERAVISVGREAWPLPIPIVERGGSWYFDSKAGRDELIRRRIGANELDAITVLRGLVEAQKEYASTVHDDSAVHQYARRLISTPGKQDGLYWTNPDGTPGGPISEPVARALEEGYTLARGTAYHGYYFRMLTGQGPAAPLGRMDYLVGDMMIGGFAFVAVPAEYGVTGIQTFIVGYDGVVYQQDLGPESLAIVRQLERYDPDESWQRTDDDW